VYRTATASPSATISSFEVVSIGARDSSGGG
jgi:hypothetical protein